MSCKFAGRHEPRVLPGRHGEDCAGDCSGCLPCSEPHCRVCSMAHADQTCAECVATTRGELHSIARMCSALPEEVEHRGIEGEAFMLLGPAVDPERWGHTEAAYLSGRLPEGWIEASHGKECPLLWNDACSGCAGGERHPMFVLGKWDAAWRDALEHDEPHGRLQIADAVDYLDRQMTYMAGYEHVSFEDFASDLKRCASHLESIIHDEPEGDRANVGCFDCGGKLERRLRDRKKGGPTDDRGGFEDHWTCTKCKRRYTYAEYNFALRANLEAALTEEPA